MALTATAVALAAAPAYEVASAAYRRYLRVPDAFAEAPEWRKLLDEAPRIGSHDAAVEALVFIDYLCPACREEQEALEQFVDQNPDLISISVLFYPRRSDAAVLAARAAVCAEKVGRFRSFNRLLLSPDVPAENFEAAIPTLHDEAGRG